MKKMLGRDAAPIHAGSPNRLPFEQDDRFSKLGRPKGGDISARSASNDRDIFLEVHGDLLPIDSSHEGTVKITDPGSFFNACERGQPQRRPEPSLRENS